MRAVMVQRLEMYPIMLTMRQELRVPSHYGAHN